MEEGKAHELGWLRVPWTASWLTQIRSALRPREVVGLRCKECGYLELYARP
jgi:hypothetical protein